jgi:copper(I)-binding protein
MRSWFIFMVLLSACSDRPVPPLVASNVEIVQAIPGQQMGVAYLTINNNTDSAIDITGVSSTDYDAVEIHESFLENGIARMRRLEKITINANSTARFERGGKHLMLMGASGTNEVSLHFHSGETLILSVTTPVTGRGN